MNKILKLFDKKYAEDLFRKKVLNLYPDFYDLKISDIKTHKNGIWETTYHVVIEFKTNFISRDGKKTKLPIFCSAHSSEPRKNVHIALRYLWNKGFAKGYLTVPHPLFYSNYFRGTFYRGIEGNNLYYYIKKNDFETVEKITAKAAHWFAKLHSLSLEGARNFNKENSRVKTIFPGKEHVLQMIGLNSPKYLDTYKKIYDIIIQRENSFLKSTKKLWLIHGDAHPENIIKVGKKKIAAIDFTDICLSDFTRDIGSFLQQLDFMCNRKIENKEFAEKLKEIFLNSYFEKSKTKYNNDVEERIKTYYNYTAIRTATYFLLKNRKEPKRVLPLLKMVKKNLL